LQVLKVEDTFWWNVWEKRGTLYLKDYLQKCVDIYNRQYTYVQVVISTFSYYFNIYIYIFETVLTFLY
jgi:hypothetical protein